MHAPDQPRLAEKIARLERRHRITRNTIRELFGQVEHLQARERKIVAEIAALKKEQV